MLKIQFQCPDCKANIEGWLSAFEYGDEPPNDETAILLDVRICDSGELYGLSVKCPKCGKYADVYR